MSAEGNKKILLVEDEILIALSQKSILSKYGYDVVIADSGEKAISMCSADTSIDLILMDIDLGEGLDGSETAGRILQRRNIPVVFLSSHTEPDIVEKTEKITSYGYVVKNTTPTVLDASIKMAFKLFKTEESMRKANILLEQTIEQSPVPIVLVSMPDAVIRYTNSACMEFLGISDEPSPVNTSLLDLKPSWKDFDMQDRQAGLGELPLARSLKGLKTENEERCVIRKDGSVRYELVSAAPIRDDKGEVIAGFLTMMDITKGKKIEMESVALNEEYRCSIEELQASNEEFVTISETLQGREKALQESEQKYRLLYTSMDQGLALHEIITDADGKPVDYVFLDINQSYTKLFGVTREASIGRSIREVMPSVEQYWIDIFGKVALTGESNYYENYLETTGRYYATYTYCPKKRQFAVLVTDITEQRKLLEALHSSERKLDTMLQSMSEGLVSVDLTGKITYSNPAAEQILDIRKDILGEYYHSTQWNQIDENGNAYRAEDLPLSVVLRDKKKVANFEHGLLSSDGKTKWISVNAAPLFDDSGSISGAVASFRDITIRKNAEGELKSLLAEKELILKEVHHRIKNNMMTIQSLLALQAGSLKDPVAVDTLEDAGRRVRTMTLLYDKLYKLSDFKEMSVRNYLPALIDEIVNNFPNRAQVRVEKKIEEFILDIKKLQTIGILINELLTNCMKYAFEGRKEGIISVELSLTGKEVCLTVSDDGIGIPESVDFTNSPGFGLVLVGALNIQLDGKLRIERGEGTTFILEFAQ